MTSQWMLWQVNPDWLTDENYHFEAFKQLTHKAYLHLDNIYHSPFVIQWWSDLHGRKSIAELYRQGRIGEDPVMTYKRLYGLSQDEFNREQVIKLAEYLHQDEKEMLTLWLADKFIDAVEDEQERDLCNDAIIVAQEKIKTL
jgi:hypothetical protein